jgi:hypothetical protein
MFSFARVRPIRLFAASPPRADAVAANGEAVHAGRDLRIDLIRGLCLWMIFVDHLPGNPLGRVTYSHFALPDALDVFILLSGISCGLLYGRLIRAAGFASAETRALRRAGQLYVANLFLGLVNVACWFAFRGVLGGDYIAWNDLTLLAREPLRAIAAMVGLLYTPEIMDILPLYMVLVLVASAVVFLLMRSAPLALALSAGVWFAAAAIPQLTLPSLGTTGAASFDPFSWQFLFCIGLWAGTRHYVDGIPFRPRRWLVALCWLIVVAGFIARHRGWFVADPGSLGWIAAPEIRTHIHPARLLNLMATAYLVATYLRADAPLLRSRWAAPLLLCGRHSLEVFCTGGAISIFGEIAIYVYGPRLWLEALATLAGLGAMTAVAWWRDGRRARVRSLVRPGATHAGRAKAQT